MGERKAKGGRHSDRIEKNQYTVRTPKRWKDDLDGL